MTRGYLTLGIRRSLVACASVITVGLTLTGEASATCFTTTNAPPLTARPQFAARAPAGAAQDQDQPANTTIVGLWNAEFLIGSGPNLFDQSFQQFHSDGTENMLSRGLPPALGNVCVGIWRQDGSRIRLKHMAWNWDADGNFIGTFMMDVVLRLDRRGNRYTGTWAADNFDTAGHVIANQHADGTVSATRIAID